jgi:DUF4097 and DUF4098 domain-containing protein YvlB
MLRSMIALTLVAAATAVSAQNRNGRADFGQPADAWCADASRGNSRERVSCDVREETLTVSSLDVDTGGNGGIRVRGAGGSASHVRFRIVAHGRAEADAQDLLKEIQISTNDGRVRVTGPRNRDGNGWSVDVEIESPREMPLTLNTSNGGIEIEGVGGRTRFETANGGVSLTNVAGDVRGRTTNGGLSVRLDGQRWEGTGLDVETTNGGVSMTLPGGYNANLSAETSNGGLDIDFPVTVQGQLTRINHRIDTTLGSGGPPIRVRTVNGGVKIASR